MIPDTLMVRGRTVNALYSGNRMLVRVQPVEQITMGSRVRFLRPEPVKNIIVVNLKLY